MASCRKKYLITENVYLEYYEEWDRRDKDTWFRLDINGHSVKISDDEAYNLLLDSQPEIDYRYFITNDDAFNYMAKFHKDFPPSRPLTITRGGYGNHSEQAEIYEDKRIAIIKWKMLREKRLKLEKEKMLQEIEKIDKESESLK